VGFNFSDGQEAEELAQQIPSKNKLFETGK